MSRRHWAYKKSHTIQLMLEEEERHVDAVRAQLAASGTRPADNSRLRTELSNAEACCRLLRQQLDSLAAPAVPETAPVSAARDRRLRCGACGAQWLAVWRGMTGSETRLVLLVTSRGFCLINCF